MAKRSVRKKRHHDPAKGFVYSATDLTDHEAIRMVGVVHEAQTRWAGKPNTPDNLETLRDEVLTKLAEIGIVATFDVAPCFYGEPPVVEYVGKVGGIKPFDHERKAWEVNEAKK